MRRDEKSLAPWMKSWWVRGVGFTRVPDPMLPENDPSAWVAKAEEDIIVVDLTLKIVPGQAAYHLQQAVEKLLKAMIVKSERRPPHIHSLVTLREAVGPDLDWTVDLDWLARVSAWVAEPRYPGFGVLWLAPTSAVVEQARDQTLMLLAEVKSRLA